MTGPRDDVTGHVIAWTEFSLSQVSPTPRSACVWGRRGLRGPRRMLRPSAISMKEDWVQGAPLHLHTQTSYAGTRDKPRRRVYNAVHARYNRCCSRSSKPYAVVFDSVLLWWGKGLILISVIHIRECGVCRPVKNCAYSYLKKCSYNMGMSSKSFEKSIAKV